MNARRIEWARAYWLVLADPAELLYDAYKDRGKRIDDLIHPLKSRAAFIGLYVDSLEDAVRQSKENPGAFDMAEEAAARLLGDPAAPWPSYLRKFAVEVFKGKRKRPAKRGRPDANFIRDLRLYLTTKAVAEHFNIGRYGRGEGASDNAAKIVAQAATEEGSYTTNEVVVHAYRRFASS